MSFQKKPIVQLVYGFFSILLSSWVIMGFTAAIVNSFLFSSENSILNFIFRLSGFFVLDDYVTVIGLYPLFCIGALVLSIVGVLILKNRQERYGMTLAKIGLICSIISFSAPIFIIGGIILQEMIIMGPL